VNTKMPFDFALGQITEPLSPDHLQTIAVPQSPPAHLVKYPLEISKASISSGVGKVSSSDVMPIYPSGRLAHIRRVYSSQIAKMD